MRGLLNNVAMIRFAYNHALSNFKANLDNDNFLSTWTLNNHFNTSKKDIDWTQAQDQRAAYMVYCILAML